MGGGASENRNRFQRWIAALVLAACGPDLPDATATDATTSTTSTSASGTLGESSTTGTRVCLDAPAIDDLEVASLEGCTPPPAIDAGVDLEVEGWPAAFTDEAGAGEGTIDALCSVVALSEGGAPLDVDLDCGDENPPVVLRILHDAQRIPLCIGDAVDLRYTRTENGIPDGGGSQRLELRRPGDDVLLAASSRRFNAAAPGEPSFAPFAFAEQSLGCEPVGDACPVTYGGFEVVSDDATWTVPHRGLRLLPTETPYVAFVADASDEGGDATCEPASSWRLDLTRAAP
ncbi:MAG: hypothetical protein KC486_19445, partial [Myxococcales bacterium]|nr:hypothetical protein [Myxococcales bacterium]